MKGWCYMFKALYYNDLLRVINTQGDVGIVTLWSKIDSAISVCIEAGIDLSSETSRVAVFANLYGNGLPHMLRNLLHNPQIRYLVVLGKNLSGSREWLVNFFQEGLEETVFLGVPTFRIKNTAKIIDGAVSPEHFTYPIKISLFGDLSNPETKDGLATYFGSLEPVCQSVLARVDPPPVPEPVVTRFPSEPRAHTIIRRTPMQAWCELVFRLFRFGYRTTVAKSNTKEERVELQNVKVVISEPYEEDSETLAQFGFDLEKFQEYQKSILDPVKPTDIGYTYGNRIGDYFQDLDGLPFNSLDLVISHLKRKPDSRHEFVSLWDNARDLPKGGNCPCFASMFFRQFDGKLTLTAIFRVHNAMDAWPENLYGLMAIQRRVADEVGIPIGPITVISLSISIDPASLERAKRVVANKKTDSEYDSVTGKQILRMDPNGAFTVTFDRTSWELVVEHSYDGMKIGEYRGTTSEAIEIQLARDVALSDISHALYLGRVLARKEQEMLSAKKTISSAP